MNITNPDQLNISVVIVNYNAGPFLAECIHSALPQVNEVLVVDNGSSDSSLELCAERFPEESKLKIIRNAANLGFAAACNIGSVQTTQPYVLFRLRSWRRFVAAHAGSAGKAS